MTTLEIEIIRTRFTDCRTHDKCDCDTWTYCWTAPFWPGSESDERIEYVPPPGFVARAAGAENYWR